MTVDSLISALRSAADLGDRYEFWASVVDTLGIKKMAEVGVYRGNFAAVILERCPDLEAYYMVDPWKHLDRWNKPANKSDTIFQGYMDEALQKTEFAARKRRVLRGETKEVIDEIADGELDFVYVDGDHTLRGITIDLIRVFPKVREGGLIGGDDFRKTIWQHSDEFEPTLVFPYAVYFAEAMGTPIYALPGSQFVIEKAEGSGFEFRDLTGKYGNLDLGSQLRRDGSSSSWIHDAASAGPRLLKRMRRMIG